MPDPTDYLPLATETPETIRARLLASVNAGIDPTDPTYLDTVPGSFWMDLVGGAVVLELDRIYDRIHHEVPAAALPTTSAGQWLDAWADGIGLARKPAAKAAGVAEFTAATGTAVPTGTQVSTVQTSADADPITFQTIEGGVVDGGGVLALQVEATTEGAQGNVPANTVTVLESSLAAPATVSNPAAITGGSDVETDEALAEPGVGFVTVFPNTPTVGHVTVRITDVNNDPAPSTVIDRLQERLDPSATPGQGAGEAPAGATVHVGTPAAQAVTVAATIALRPGYSLDGASGTRAVADAVTAAVARYVNGLDVGADVVHNKVLAAIVDVEGVEDVTVLELDGDDTANVAVDDLHVATLDGAPALTGA
jgi:uncharacterized phage protein gp47/JayE